MKYSTEMKTLSAALLLALGVSSALAGPVTVTKTWAAGDALNAADLNQNFSDVKTAVDDNNARLTNIAGAGACPANEFVSGIDLDGIVTCLADSNTTYSAGTGISISRSNVVSSQISANVSHPRAQSLTTTAITSVATINVVPPSSGFLLLTFSGKINKTSTSNVNIGVGVFSKTKPIMPANSMLITGSAGERSYSIQALVPVKPARFSGVDFSGVVQKLSAAGSVIVTPQSLTAVFIPSTLSSSRPVFNTGSLVGSVGSVAP